MKCLRYPDRDCPGNGCADMSDCAIADGWSQGVAPPPPENTGFAFGPAPRWLERLAVIAINGATMFFVGLTWIVRDVHPFTWGVITAAIAFTVGLLVF